MIPLPIGFHFDDFEFNLLDRDRDVALFEKTKKGIDAVFYEVVIVQKSDDHTWPDGRLTPAHEHMPHSNHWGTLGWSLQTRDRAFEKFREVVAKNTRDE